MDPRMKNLIEVSVDSIRIHMPTAQHLVILKEKEADRYLPIWIGSFEAQAIATKISGNSLGRPLTHDLMATAFGDLGISVRRIVVTRLADQVFYARLYVKQNGRDLDFDARPSDAIALAVRVECPIFVATEVMDTAGIIPEADEMDGDKDKAETVVDEALDNLTNGPTLMVGDMMRMAEEVFKTLSRNDAVKMVIQAGAQAMGSDGEH